MFSDMAIIYKHKNMDLNQMRLPLMMISSKDQSGLT
jgi:hypothetical protein